MISPITERTIAMIAADDAKASNLRTLCDKVNQGTTAFTDEERKAITQALAFQSAQLQQDTERRKHALECGSEDGNLISHDEKHILSGCVSLINEAVNAAKDYIDFCGIAQEEDDEERFEFSLSYAEIVRRLFLWNTSHSGGTSTWAKCRELGINPSTYIEFAQEQEEED